MYFILTLYLDYVKRPVKQNHSKLYLLVGSGWTHGDGESEDTAWKYTWLTKPYLVVSQCDMINLTGKNDKK